MPRENVRGQLVPAPDGTVQQPVVQVRWERELETVTVASSILDPGTGLPYQPEPNGSVPFFGGFTVGDQPWPHHPYQYQTGDMLPTMTVQVQHDPDLGDEPDQPDTEPEPVALIDQLDVQPLLNPYAGMFVELSREQLNQLIRVLKRAGKQAFGDNEW